MPNPLERLTKIISTRQPTIVKFRATTTAGNSSILLNSVVVKTGELTAVTEDKELFELLSVHVTETWSVANERFEVSATVNFLWEIILNHILHVYENISERCNATKRKTANFIRKVKIDDKLLAEFMLQTYLKIKSDSYKEMLEKDRITLFEQFDSLRRTFGKRA